MNKDKTVKRYIYVSSKKRVELEEVCAQKSIFQQVSFINTYDCNTLFQSGLKNLNGVSFLFLDVSAIVNPNKKIQEIISNLTLIRKMYPDLRIIIIAEGYKIGDTLLGRIFNLGIYNIITSSNNLEFMQELEQTISEDGMTFGNAMKYKLDYNMITIGSSGTKVQKEFIKAKQMITIGVLSTERHLGATSLAINICKYINEMPNEKACLIENNRHGTIKSFINFQNALFFEKVGKICFSDIDMFLKPKSIASIQNMDYSFYIYDYGAFNELSENEKNSFLEKDIKFVVTGSRIWEYPKIADTIFYMKDDKNTNLYVNYTKLDEREVFKRNFDSNWQEKIYFSQFNPNPFELLIDNRDYFKKIFSPYLLNSVIEEKKKGLKWLFKKGK